MEVFVGKFQRISTEKQTELLQALGLSSMCIRLASLAPHPVLEISLEQDGEVVIRTTSGFRSHVKRFRLGQPFEDTTYDGRRLVSVCRLEGARLVSEQKASTRGVVSTRSVREMRGPDTLVYTVAVEGSDLECVQIFNRMDT